MDTKVEINEEDSPSVDMFAQNKTELFSEKVTRSKNGDTVLLYNDWDMAIKTEIKSETPVTNEWNKFEAVKCSNYWEIDVKREAEEQTVVSEFGSQNETENPVMKVKEYSSDHKIEIKEESCWLQTEILPVCDDIKDMDFPPAKSSRLSAELVSSDISCKSPLSSADVSGRGTHFYNGTNHLDYENHKNNVIPAEEQHIFSEQSGKCSDQEKMYITTFSLKQNNFIPVTPEGNGTHQCKICDKIFTRLSYLKKHTLVHDGRKPHKCKICDKRFTRSSYLKMHSLVHEDKKPHQCKICDKGFTQVSYLKTHYLIHEGKKPHQCKVCDKSFTQLSHLKMHTLIHMGEKPYQCKTCDKSFTLLPYLKTHCLTHEDKKVHQCKTCSKSFSQLSYLKKHCLLHEGKKLHQCKICDKSFTQLSFLKAHNLIHGDRKRHLCKICNKTFVQLGYLKTHYLIHEGKKPHQCQTCDKSFTRSSDLKRHIVIHDVATVITNKSCLAISS